MVEFELRHWITDNGGLKMKTEGGTTSYITSSQNTIGNTFYGSKGYMVKTVDKWQTFMGKEKEPGETGGGLGNHYKNFADAVRANDRTNLNAPIEEGVYSCALIHLANISYRVGRTLYFDPETMRIKGDNEANRMLTKEYREPYVVPKKV